MQVGTTGPIIRPTMVDSIGTIRDPMLTDITMQGEVPRRPLRLQKYIPHTSWKLAYNMDAPEDKKLVFVVTSSFQDPTRLDKTVAAYAKYVISSLEKKR